MKLLLHCFSLVLGLLVPVAAQAQLPPEKMESTFTVADGLEMKLWASDPLFVNPTCIDIDHKGRVWVCESVNYRNRLHGKKTLTRPAGDRIVILEDSKGTGKADKAITFYKSPELLAPLGIAVAKDPVGPGYKVYVCHSPDILLFEDKDGDGKADGPPKKLLSGFGGYDHDHGVHGILIGPDGKLYFSVGDTGVHGLQSADGKGRKWHSNDTDCRAGTIWRCDLDGKNLELLAHNFRNEYEPCVDSFGTVFVSDNDDDGNQQTRICYVMPGGNYGYHPRGPGQSHWHEEQPGVVPKILRTGFGSPTGMCVYEGTLLPKKYRGQLLHTDAGPRHVRCYHLKPKGAGYDVDREDMVTSTDNWFRPSDICVAPDGSVFVADWYDPGVGGHGMADTTRGRIYRLAPKGSKYIVPKLDLSSKEGILEALASPNRSVNHLALAQLLKVKIELSLDVMRTALVQKENAPLRARGLWLLDWLQNRIEREVHEMP
jgi:putative membrane-bound dehydrogenase-like protein